MYNYVSEEFLVTSFFIDSSTCYCLVYKQYNTTMKSLSVDPDFPCSLTILVPLPTNRLASSALRALEVDAELSPLVRRTFSLDYPQRLDRSYEQEEHNTDGKNSDAKERKSWAVSSSVPDDEELSDENRTVLRTEYKATTIRMLRVAVNGFMESLGVVLGVMEELDVDVLAQSLERENV